MAHPVPGEVRAELERQLAPYRRAFRDVRWTRPASWHLTLLFLGSVAPDRVPDIGRLVDAVALRFDPYDVVVDHGDGRVRRGEGVAWLGLSAGAGRLIEMAIYTAGACPPGITDGARPKRTPSAHLTVVRKADTAVVQALREQAAGAIEVGWRVDRVQLVRSHLEPGGARYETLYEATL
jgi:2'-5' RNA ligase